MAYDRTQLYGNKIGRLAQGIPGRTTGTDTIHFIPGDNRPREWTKDFTYSLITVLIQPEKLKNQTGQD
jgi:hypothetical protein